MKTQIHSFLNSSLGGKCLAVLIFLSLLAFTLETEFSNLKIFNYLGIGIAAIFGVEYLCRIWVADYGRSDKLKARWEYVTSFHGLIDLIAFLPALLVPAAGGSVVLRLARISRLLQLMKFKPLTEGLKRTSQAIRQSKNELITSTFVCGLTLFIGAVMMYHVEGKIQPKAFGSIPRALLVVLGDFNDSRVWRRLSDNANGEVFGVYYGHCGDCGSCASSGNFGWGFLER